MPNSRPPYPPAYRREIVALHAAGRSVQSLAKAFEPCSHAITTWIKQADIDEGVREDGLTTAERSEFRQLRRDNARLREEREILKSAAACFAR